MYGLLLAVGSAARALDDRAVGEAWPVEAVWEAVQPQAGIRLARFAPRGAGDAHEFVWSVDRQLLLLVDGYVYSEDAPETAPRVDHARAFAERCRRDGFDAAIRSVAGGTFNLAVVDLARSRCHVTTDPLGTLPLYHGPVDGGWLLSTNPVALARTGLVDRTPDMTALAEFAYIGYAIGDRFMLKGIRVVRPCTSFRWDCDRATGSFEENPGSPWRILADGRGPSPDALTDASIASCRRTQLFEPRPAHLLSAGKDSRFILASWPDGYDPPCYTHGDIDSHEVEIARSVAAIRGSRWSHVWMDGDEVASDLGEVFSLTGMIVFVDRLLAARRIRQDGFTGVLDGYLGGIFQGGAYLDCDRHFSRLARTARFLTVFVDQRVSRVGKDRIAEALLDSLLEVRTDDALRQFVDDAFVSALRAEWPAVQDDLRDEVERFTPENDSLAALWNRLILGNRGAHAIVQQMAIMRSFLDVYCPFSGDLEYLRLQWAIPPRRSAYKRTYVEMYRRRFPQYGKVPYGDSLLPLTRPPLLHKWSAILMSKHISVPFLSGDPKGRERDATSWNKWLRQSGAMRDTALAFLREGGILDEARAARTLETIRTGAARGSGKLFHLASISKWLAYSGGRAG